MTKFIDIINFHLQGTQGFGVVPPEIQKINEEFGKDKQNCSLFADLIESDTYISSKIFKLVNAPYFESPEMINSLGKACELLSFEVVRNLVIFIKFLEFVKANDEGIINKRLFIKHSVGVGLVANILADHAGRKFEGECPKHVYLLGGLWHDVGRLVFEFCLKEEYRHIKDDGYVRFTSLNQLEQEKIGINHIEAGVLIAKRWQVNPLFIDVIQGHHNPFVVPSDNVVVMIEHVANYLCNYQSIGNSGELAPPIFYDRVCEKLQLPKSSIPQILKDVESAIPILDEMYRIFLPQDEKGL